MEKDKIRPAEKGEMPAIKEMIATRPDVLAQKRLPDRCSFFVAVTTDVEVVATNEEIVGFAAIQIHDGEAEFRSLYVSPEHNGHNLGYALWRACLEKAQSRKVRAVRLMTAIPGYFKQFGFRPEKTGKIAMVLSLANEHKP